MIFTIVWIVVDVSLTNDSHCCLHPFIADCIIQATINMKYLTKFLLLAVAVSTVSAQRCSTTDDCVADAEYCAGNVCTPIGSCNQRLDCFNPENSPYASLFCEGTMECTDNLCGMICGPPSCPNGEPPAECVPGNFPCDLSFCREASGCYNDPCGASGACSAVFYDAAGTIVCNNDEEPVTLLPGTIPPIELPEPSGAVVCNLDFDCEGAFDETEAYCSEGSCLSMGSCSKFEDCVNPSNRYAIIECVGELSCTDGQCGRQCGSSSCAEGVEEVNCFADPCMDYQVGCPVATSCARSFCGECAAILFDQAGFVLEDCNENTTGLFDAEEMICMSDVDCGDDEYCADEVCLKIGECLERVDCFNPANSPYPVATCIGLLDCTNNTCSIACGPECPDGELFLECPEPSACNISSCDEAVSCAFDGCGGECTEIFYNDAGTQVCDAKTTDNVCFSDADCTGIAIAKDSVEEVYCAQGVCMEMGTCTSDLDCMNPANIYASLACVGYTSCQSGFCGVTCGPGCKDGSEWSACDPSPCEDQSCDAATSCTNDVCNGCNAIFLDAAGFEVKSCDEIAFASAKDVAGAFSRYSLISGLAVGAIFVLSLLVL